MRYHDFHLFKYDVSDYGKTITFQLTWNYPGEKQEDSSLRFSGVALYNFTHTAGTIITEITEVSTEQLLPEFGGQLTEWNRLYGIEGWNGSAQAYLHKLQDDGLRAWCIESAIGFGGFVIACSVDQA